MSHSGRRIALVTGASRGIGRAIAIELARDGFYVTINYRSNHAAAEEVQREIQAIHGECTIRGFDVSDRGLVEATIRELSKEIGTLDVLVNNAGIIRDQPLVRMRDADWDDVVATNLTGVYQCTKAVLKTWAGKKRGSRIISITSVIGEMGNSYQTNYASTKAGIIGFTKSLARELASRGITVNAVAPGLVETDATAHLPAEAYSNRIPLGRLGRPEDVAYAVSFLASERASYITGHVIRVDGGWYMDR